MQGQDDVLAVEMLVLLAAAAVCIGLVLQAQADPAQPALDSRVEVDMSPRVHRVGTLLRSASAALVCVKAAVCN